MKKICFAALLLLGLQACGDMDNNVNENHTHYTDSSGVNPDDAGNPASRQGPARATYDTDSMTSTSGPDNAAPKSNAMDSANSLNPNSNNGVTNENNRRNTRINTNTSNQSGGR